MIRLDTLRAAEAGGWEAYHSLVEKNEARLDRYAEHEAEIVDQRLGLNQEERPREDDKRIKSLGRKSWGQVAAKAEADSRRAMWADQIKRVEEQDAKKNVSTTTTAS